MQQGAGLVVADGAHGFGEYVLQSTLNFHWYDVVARPRVTSNGKVQNGSFRTALYHRKLAGIWLLECRLNTVSRREKWVVDTNVGGM